MKNTFFKGVSVMSLAVTLGGIGTSFAFADDIGSTSSDGKVGFIPGDSPGPQDTSTGTTSVNPQTPNMPASPGTSGTPGNAVITGKDKDAGLYLDYVPNESFGIHKLSNKTQILTSYPVVYQAVGVNTVDKQVPNATTTKAIATTPYIQVSDMRGLGIGKDNGWTVTVAASQYTSSKGNLSGAVVTFNADGKNTVVNSSKSIDGNSKNIADSPLNSQKVVLTPSDDPKTPGESVNIFSSGSSTDKPVGTYTNLLNFGVPADQSKINKTAKSGADTLTLEADGKSIAKLADPKGSSLIADPALKVGSKVTTGTGQTTENGDNMSGLVNPNTTLTVPGGSVYADTYTSKFTWTLNNVPTGQSTP